MRDRFDFSRGTAVVTGAAAHPALVVGTTVVDLADDAATTRVAAELAAAHPEVTLLVNNAKIPKMLETVTGQTAYAASKFPVRGFSEALRHELADDGVGVTVVHPGGIATRIAETARVGSGVSADEAEQGRARFARLLTIPPATAAARILAAVERRRPRVLIGWSAKVPDALVRILPGSYWTLVARAAGRRVRPPGRD